MTFNPFEILEVTPKATKAEILQAAARAIQKEPGRLQAIAEAQKNLFAPDSRAASEFLFDLNLQALLADTTK